MTPVLLCAMSCCPQIGRSFPLNYVLLLAITVGEALIVGSIAAIYPTGIVVACAAMAGAVFLALTLFAFVTDTDFTGCGVYLFAVLMAVLIFGLTVGVMQMNGLYLPQMDMLCGACIVVLYAGYIVYDTQLMLGELKGHKYSFAAMSLYLDIINLFLELLQLFGSRD